MLDELRKANFTSLKLSAASDIHGKIWHFAVGRGGGTDFAFNVDFLGSRQVPASVQAPWHSYA